MIVIDIRRHEATKVAPTVVLFPFIGTVIAAPTGGSKAS